MAYPVYISSGDQASGTGDITVPLPGGLDDNDLVFCVLASANQTLPEPSGAWKEVIAGAQSVGTAGANTAIKGRVFWGKASEVSPVFVPDPGNHAYGIMFYIRHVSGDACVVTASAGATQAAALGRDVTFPSIAVGDDESLVLSILLTSEDSNITTLTNITNSSLSSLSYRAVGGTTQGNGSTFVLIAGDKATAGSVASTTGNIGANAGQALFTIFVAPPGATPEGPSAPTARPYSFGFIA